MPLAAKNITRPSTQHTARQMQASDGCPKRVEQAIYVYEVRVLGLKLDLVNTACCAGCIILLSHKTLLYIRTYYNLFVRVGRSSQAFMHVKHIHQPHYGSLNDHHSTQNDGTASILPHSPILMRFPCCNQTSKRLQHACKATTHQCAANRVWTGCVVNLTISTLARDT